MVRSSFSLDLEMLELNLQAWQKEKGTLLDLG